MSPFRLLLCSPLLLGLLLPVAALPQSDLWTQRYDGEALDDNPCCVALDAEGAVYVTGTSSSTHGHLDYMTVKYSKLGGLQWVRRYDEDGGIDWPIGIVVRGDGVVLVSGNVEYEPFPGELVPNMRTIAYDATTGDSLWVDGISNSFTYCEAVTGDAAEGAYVVGTWDYGPWAIWIMRHPAMGQGWSRFFLGRDSIFAASAASAPDGTLFVSGTIEAGYPHLNFYLLAVSDQGYWLWDREYDFGDEAFRSVASATDPGKNLVVAIRALEGTSDYRIVRFDSLGSMLWEEIYDGAGGDDWATDIATGANGSVYVTGSSWGGIETGSDIVTLKFSADGGFPEWVARYDGPASGDDFGAAIALDPAGYVYVTGSTYDGESTNFVTIMYRADGTEVWRALYDGATRGNDRGADVAASEGRIAVTGSSWGTGTQLDFLTIAYGAFPIGVAEPTAASRRPASLLTIPNPVGRGDPGIRIVAEGLGIAGEGSLMIYDHMGRLVRQIAPGISPMTEWDLRDASGHRVPAGVYFVGVSAGRSALRTTITVLP